MVMTAARRRGFTAASASLCLLFATASPAAAVAVHTVRTDLKPLIRAASEAPAQFAVLLPHAVSSADGGTWSSAGGQATWRYAVQVPTAVSLSFHAVQVSLPASATLIVRGATTTTSYRARDLHRGELWSRIQPGAGLEFTLSVAASERARVTFRLVSLQAGYRSLGAGVQDHPYYRQLRQALLVDNTSCVTNYACRVTPANTAGEGQAQVKASDILSIVTGKRALQSLTSDRQPTRGIFAPADVAPDPLAKRRSINVIRVALGRVAKISSRGFMVPGKKRLSA